MKLRGKLWHSIVMTVFILIFAMTAFFGVSSQYGDIRTVFIKGASDIRFGVDIQGGVNVTFVSTDDYDATDDQLEAAESVIENRLIAIGVTDYEIYVDSNDDSIILSFPWQSGEEDYDPEAAIEEIGATAYLTFREGYDADGTLILDGAQVASASAAYGAIDSSGSSEYYVALSFDDTGAAAFATSTTTLAAESGVISIWLDDECVSTASVKSAITGGEAIIQGEFTQDEVITLARQINSGSLPFSLEVDSYSTQSPSLGENSLTAMVIAGVIAFAFVVIIMIAMYRLVGVFASIALLGQVAATLAVISGYFSVFTSFTLTLPGIAGIILAIGMGVDANVITAERIKEELRTGKSLDGSIKTGFERGLSPVVDGNVTIVIVSIVLMGAFGPTDGIFAQLLNWAFFAFGASTAGSIYAFGYTLLTGVLLNFVFGIFATRVMIRGAIGCKALRNPWLYGGKKAEIGEAQIVVPKPAYNVVGLRKKFAVVSTCLIAAILACSLVFGVQLDTEFTGGAMITLSYEGDVDVASVTEVAETALEHDNLQLQTGNIVATGEQTLSITMPGNETVTVDQVQALVETLETEYPDSAFEQLSLSNVSASMGTKFLQKSLVALFIALAFILAYIAIRFKNIGGLTGGMMSIVALVNDLLMVFASFVVLRTALDGNFIAAMLTILGYSINDTVVVYDRIRENRKLLGKHVNFEELVNISVNQSARRTFVTTLTTVTSLGVMCVVAKVYSLDSIFTFVFPLMIGMLSGVYTSLCVSTSCWVFWNEKTGNKSV